MSVKNKLSLIISDNLEVSLHLRRALEITWKCKDETSGEEFQCSILTTDRGSIKRLEALSKRALVNKKEFTRLNFKRIGSEDAIICISKGNFHSSSYKVYKGFIPKNAMSRFYELKVSTLIKQHDLKSGGVSLHGSMTQLIIVPDIVRDFFINYINYLQSSSQTISTIPAMPKHHTKLQHTKHRGAVTQPSYLVVIKIKSLT